MHSDAHLQFRQAIDAAMAAGSAENPALRRHLESCAACQEYLSANQRVIAGLGGFAFAVDPGRQAATVDALQQRARQLEPVGLRRRRWGLACLVAFALTLGGSLIDVQLGGWLAALLHVPGWQVRQAMMTFWIVPSLGPLLVLPVLPLLLRKERAL